MMNESPSNQFRILLVEDDTALASMVSDYLATQGFDVAVEPRGDVAVSRINDEVPDAVILDVNLPGLDGFSVCRSVRDSYPGAIIMLTARGEEVDEVLGLEAGADDYLAKPVRPMALLARLKAHLRRSTPAEQATQTIEVGSLVVDPARRCVAILGDEVELTTAEFDLLYLLAQQAGKTVSRNDIYENIHGMKYDGIDRSIDLRISRLRKKLGDDPLRPDRIKSIRGVGYQLSIEL